jgi:formate dehydrogenase subunit gamma
MALAFVLMFFRFKSLNKMTPATRNGCRARRDDRRQRPQHAGTGQVQRRPEAMFWAMAVCMLLLFVSGIFLWRAYFSLPVDLVRLGAVVHAAIAAIMIAMIFVHVYAALWVRGTVRAMVYGTVTRAWAKQHHRAWYRQVTGK